MKPRHLRGKRLSADVVLLAFDAPKSRLTNAERAIAIQVLGGWSNARIARKRGVSIRTIANQIASLLKKLRVTSRTELAARFSATDLLNM